MRVVLLALCSLCSLLASDDISASLVKLEVTVARADYNLPWSGRRPSGGVGSGFIIEGQRILTAAHVVADATFIQIQRHGESKKWPAEVLHCVNDTDLAIVVPKDPAFFAGSAPLAFGELPELRSTVTAYGFPTGGVGLSITSGVISRVEMINYVHSGWSFMAVQIDAAINPGNSGGPAVQDGKVVGVSMQGNTKADNIGYIVPVPVIRHVLADLEDGRYDGFPGLGLRTQEATNPSMRSFHRLDDERGGVLVNGVIPGGPCVDKVQADDILLAVDGVVIGSDGSVPLRGTERINANHVILQHQIGDVINLHIVRAGVEHDIEVTLDKPQQDFSLVPKRTFDEDPAYMIYGGAVFMPLSTNYLELWGGGWRQKAPNGLLYYAFNAEWPTTERREVVILHRVLAAEGNRGYDQMGREVVKAVDGQVPRDLAHFAALVDAAAGDYIRIDFESGRQFLLERSVATGIDATVRQRYRIPEMRSAGL